MVPIILSLSLVEKSMPILTSRFSVFLGEISYGIYILQYPVIVRIIIDAWNNGATKK